MIKSTCDTIQHDALRHAGLWDRNRTGYEAWMDDYGKRKGMTRDEVLAEVHSNWRHDENSRVVGTFRGYELSETPIGDGYFRYGVTTPWGMSEGLCDATEPPIDYLSMVADAIDWLRARRDKPVHDNGAYYAAHVDDDPEEAFEQGAMVEVEPGTLLTPMDVAERWSVLRRTDRFGFKPSEMSEHLKEEFEPITVATIDGYALVNFKHDGIYDYVAITPLGGFIGVCRTERVGGMYAYWCLSAILEACDELDGGKLEVPRQKEHVSGPKTAQELVESMQGPTKRPKVAPKPARGDSKPAERPKAPKRANDATKAGKAPQIAPQRPTETPVGEQMTLQLDLDAPEVPEKAPKASERPAETTKTRSMLDDWCDEVDRLLETARDGVYDPVESLMLQLRGIGLAIEAVAA